jgi:hypothetical protein
MEEVRKKVTETGPTFSSSIISLYPLLSFRSRLFTSLAYSNVVNLMSQNGAELLNGIDDCDKQSSAQKTWEINVNDRYSVCDI